MKQTWSKFVDHRYTLLGINIAVSVVFLGIFVILGRFINVQKRVFVLILSILMILYLLFLVLFMLSVQKKKKAFRNITICYGVFLALFGSIGLFYGIRVQSTLNSIFVGKQKTEAVEFSVVEFSKEGQSLLAYVDGDTAYINEMKRVTDPLLQGVTYEEFESYQAIIDALEAQEVTHAVLPKEFKHLFTSETQEALLDKAHIIQTFSTTLDASFNSNVDVLKEPFTVMITGLNDGLSDTMMLASFNPQTLKATLTSIPRDSYVPIACYRGNALDKINHSRGVSRQCMIDTVENLLDVSIDFYFETDFYALIKMVDAVGGLEVTSPVAFSGSLPIEGKVKEWEPVHIPKGTSMMNGKQVVTFARERKHMPAGDFDRQRNQQIVMQLLLEKMMETRNPNTFLSILDAANGNFVTNFTQDEITGLVGFALNQVQGTILNPIDVFRIETYQILGTTPMVGTMSVINPYVEGLEYASQLVAQNLKPIALRSEIQTMAFDIETPFTYVQERVWGGQVLNDLTPSVRIEDWVGMSESHVHSFGSQNGMEVYVTYVDTEDKSKNGIVLDQAPSAGSVVEVTSSIRVKVYRYVKKEVVVPQEIKMPWVVGKNINDVLSSLEALPLQVIIEYTEEAGVDGEILSQSLASETVLIQNKPQTVTLVVRKAVEAPEETPEETPEVPAP